MHDRLLRMSQLFTRTWAGTNCSLPSALMQLRELDALSDEAQREAMQRLIDEVSKRVPGAHTH